MTNLRTTKEQRAEWMALAGMATRGPWKHYSAPLRAQFPTPINEVQRKDGKPVVNWGGFDHEGRKATHEANAAFIAAANPATILSLIERVERAEADKQAAETLIDYWKQRTA